jgi:hypothetical protein
VIEWAGQREDGWFVRVIVDELDPSAASVQVRAPGDRSTWQPLVELSRTE